MSIIRHPLILGLFLVPEILLVSSGCSPNAASKPSEPSNAIQGKDAPSVGAAEKFPDEVFAGENVPQYAHSDTVKIVPGNAITIKRLGRKTPAPGKATIVAECEGETEQSYVTLVFAYTIVRSDKTEMTMAFGEKAASRKGTFTISSRKLDVAGLYGKRPVYAFVVPSFESYPLWMESGTTALSNIYSTKLSFDTTPAEPTSGDRR